MCLPTLKKRLLLFNVLTAELSVAVDNNQKDLKSLRWLFSRKVLKKYWSIRAATNEISLDRRKLGRVRPKYIVSQRGDPVSFDKAKAELSEKVVSFLERDDSSRVITVKKDFKNVTKTNEYEF